MKKESVKKVMIVDEGLPVFAQLMTKAKSLFGEGTVDYVRVGFPESADEEAMRHHLRMISAIENAVRKEDPDILLIGATAFGEEAAPALGVRLETGVAAHCTEIYITGDGQIAYCVPAFGGKVIGEIFIPETRPQIATIKPGMFDGDEETAGAYRTVPADPAAADDMSGKLRLKEIRPHRNTSEALSKARIIVCGGFGIGSEENWKKIELLAQRLGGAAGCTRPVVDMGWGPDEYSMIGTSGRTVKPKVYVGFGISGAAHHLCGIRDADVIISINNDKEAEIFRSSDYVGVMDAGKVIDALLAETQL